MKMTFQKHRLLQKPFPFSDVLIGTILIHSNYFIVHFTLPSYFKQMSKVEKFLFLFNYFNIYIRNLWGIAVSTFT